MSYATCRFFDNCVGFNDYNDKAQEELSQALDDATEISRSTFFRHVPLEDVRDLFGYASHPSRGMTISNDCHIQYFRTKLAGHRCYVVVHSGIEYFFVTEKDFEALNEIRRTKWRKGIKRRSLSFLASDHLSARGESSTIAASAL